MNKESVNDIIKYLLENQYSDVVKALIRLETGITNDVVLSKALNSYLNEDGLGYLLNDFIIGEAYDEDDNFDYEVEVKNEKER